MRNSKALYVGIWAVVCVAYLGLFFVLVTSAIERPYGYARPTPPTLEGVNVPEQRIGGTFEPPTDVPILTIDASGVWISHELLIHHSKMLDPYSDEEPDWLDDGDGIDESAADEPKRILLLEERPEAKPKRIATFDSYEPPQEVEDTGPSIEETRELWTRYELYQDIVQPLYPEPVFVVGLDHPTFGSKPTESLRGDPLYEALAKSHSTTRKWHRLKGDYEEGRILVRIHKNVPMRVVNRLFYALGQAEYRWLTFMVRAEGELRVFNMRWLSCQMLLREEHRPRFCASTEFHLKADSFDIVMREKDMDSCGYIYPEADPATNWGDKRLGGCGEFDYREFPDYALRNFTHAPICEVGYITATSDVPFSRFVAVRDELLSKTDVNWVLPRVDAKESCERQSMNVPREEFSPEPLEWKGDFPSKLNELSPKGE